MDYGIQIYLPQLNTISVAKDGKSAKIGGGVNSKNLIDALWEAGKQTGRSNDPRHMCRPLTPISHRNVRMRELPWTSSWRRSRLASGPPWSNHRPVHVDEHRSSEW